MLTMKHLETLFEICAVQMIMDGESHARFNNWDCPCIIEIWLEDDKIRTELEWCDDHEQDILGAYMGSN